MIHALLGALLLGIATPNYASLMKSGHVPGMQVLVIQDGKVASNTSYGVRNLATGQPVDEHTRFEIGSITKQFTAAAILQLRDAGKLSLDDKLGKYFPQYARAKDVTLRQMLFQISGIPNFTSVKAFNAMIKVVNGRYAMTQPGSLAGVLDLIKGKPLDFTPGTKWEYSNSNYFLLGEIVASVGKMPWEQYIAQNIFSKAGMTESAFMKDETKIPDMATGYVFEKGRYIPTGDFNGWAQGAGAIVSTAGDLAKWDAAFFGNRIVPAQDVALITSAGPVPAIGKTYYGFGWLLDAYDGQARVWHNGGTMGFNASNQVYPAVGQTVIVLASAGHVADRLAERTFDSLHPDLAAATAKPAEGEDFAVTARIKAIYAQLMSEKPDRSQFTEQANKAFTPALLSMTKTQLSSLGEPTTWVFKGKTSVGNLTAYRYRVMFSGGMVLAVIMTVDKTNKIAGYAFAPATD